MGLYDDLVRLLTQDYMSARPGLVDVALRAALVYAAGLFLVRLGKSRMISRATALDVILGFVLGSLLSRGITGSASVASTVVGAAVLISLHWLATEVAEYVPWFEGLLKGHVYVLIENGVIKEENLKRSHLTRSELEEQLRLNGQVEHPEDVKIAYKERRGEISVIRKSG